MGLLGVVLAALALTLWYIDHLSKKDPPSGCV